MSLPQPALPSPLTLSWLLFIQVVPMTLACLFWAGDGGSLTALGWCLLALLTYAPVLFVSPLLRRLFARNAAGEEAVRARWWLYYGSFAIAGMACGALWHGLTHALLGAGLSWLVDLLWGAFIGDFTAFFAEQLSRYVLLARLQASKSREALDKVRITNAAFLKAQIRRRREVATSLEQVLEGDLSAIQARLAAWRAGLETSRAPRPCEPVERKALLADLEALRERELRHLGRVLHPTVINVGLGIAVRSLLDHVARDHVVTITMDARFREADDPLVSRFSPDVRLGVYRAIEQAVDNVLRHARATTLRIAMTLSDEDMIGVTVEDDGAGLDPANLELGVGLSTVSGRVELLGGRCSLEAAENGGARLRLSLPLELKPPE